MLDIPMPIIIYLLNLIIEQHSLAYLLVNKDGYLSQWGGKLTLYGVFALHKEEKAEKQIFFLEGLLPLDDEPILIPRIKTEYGICADVHLFPSKDGDWVLFLDASLEELHLEFIQQHLNESTLIQEQVAKTLNQ
jgi:hypothetical protein